MDFLRRSLILSDTNEKIRRVGLRNLNLLGSSGLYKYNSPKQTFSKKRINKKILFNINSPRATFNSKIKSMSSPDFFSSSLSITKDTKLTPLNTKNFKNYKQNFFKKTLLISNNMNIYTPKIRTFKQKEKNELLNSNDKKNRTLQLFKNPLSDKFKMTNVKNVLNYNFKKDKNSTPVKSRAINLVKLIEKKNKEKTRELMENNKLMDNEKNMFRNKLIRKKIDEDRQNILYRYRKVYPFVRVSDVEENNIFPESLNKINKKELSTLLYENKSIFQHRINIMKKGQFSKKYERPPNIFLLEPEKKQSFEIKEIPLGVYILNNEIIKNKNNIKNKNIDMNELVYKFKKVLFQINLINKNLLIPLSEIIKEYKIPNNIIHHNRTHYLNDFIKIGDFVKAMNIISADHSMVISLDYFDMTPLHYAAKYNFYQIIPHLMHYGAYVDAKNSFGMTPLILCIQRNLYESIILLFLYMANPFIDIEKNSLIDSGVMKLEFYTKNICKSIKEIYCKNIYAGVKNLHKSIQNDIVKFAKNECQDFLELDFINLIKTNFKID